MKRQALEEIISKTIERNIDYRIITDIKSNLGLNGTDYLTFVHGTTKTSGGGSLAKKMAYQHILLDYEVDYVHIKIEKFERPYPDMDFKRMVTEYYLGYENIVAVRIG